MALDPARFRGYTPIDLVSMAYVAFCLAVVALGGSRVPSHELRLVLYSTALAGLALLRWAPRAGWRPFQFLREAYPLLLLTLAYSETAALGRAFTDGYHDALVLRWERALFGALPSLIFSQWAPSRLLSELLHFCYLAYIALVPTLGLTLFFRGRSELLRGFVTTIMLTFLVCYATFILFPVRGPYYELERPVVASFGIFPPIVHAMLARGAAVGAAFPSSHVAAAVVVAMMAHRFSRPMSYAMAFIAVGIFFGTVYGGFHYAVDAVAGLIWGVIAGNLGPGLHRRLTRVTRQARAGYRTRAALRSPRARAS